jgi:hypothetical protein
MSIISLLLVFGLRSSILNSKGSPGKFGMAEILEISSRKMPDAGSAQEIV